MTNSKKVKQEIKSFYSIHNKKSHKEKIQHVISPDVFSTRLELAKTERDKEYTIEKQDFLQKVNGTVVWGKTSDDPITVIFALEAFQQDTYSWRGTVHHEYTHAHDFWDLATYLGITVMDELYDFPHYRLFELWSEYHARKNGAMNVYRHEYSRETAKSISNICDIMLQEICVGLTQSPNAYHAMQWFGRYAALEQLYGASMSPLQAGIERYGISQQMVNVERFLHTHSNFDLIITQLDQFDVLLNAV